jgi:hypothetical protein
MNTANRRRAIKRWLRAQGVIAFQERDDSTVLRNHHRIRSKRATKTDGKSIRKFNRDLKFQDGCRLESPPFRTGKTWLKNRP